MEKRFREQDELRERKYKSSGGYFQGEIFFINFYGNILFQRCMEIKDNENVSLSSYEKVEPYKDVIFYRFQDENIMLIENEKKFDINFEYQNFNIHVYFKNNDLKDIIFTHNYDYINYDSIVDNLESKYGYNNNQLSKSEYNKILKKNFVNNKILSLNYEPPNKYYLNTIYYNLHYINNKYYKVSPFDDFDKYRVVESDIQYEIDEEEANEILLSALTIVKDYIENRDDELKIYPYLLFI